MNPEPDPTRCPLCDQPNACALAKSGAAARAECWCAARPFPAALLARLPAASVGRACICQACQRAAAADPE
jgi:hypothetical protein